MAVSWLSDLNEAFTLAQKEGKSTFLDLYAPG
ncbi:MAG: thioredoxin family protein [Fimbriimonadales bacterium]|jgi:hypothetical protein|nr:thioredoxin family protein [Fimbriimonadales bacterium]